MHQGRLEGRRGIAWFLTGAIGVVTMAAVAGQQDAVRLAFERVATTPERFVDVQCVLSGRATGRLGCEHHAGQALEGHSFPLEAVQALTSHANPRVRTLAIGDLFSRGDPRLLPAIFARVEDSALTFPAPVPEARFYADSAVFRDVPKESQTVGKVATTLLDAYLRRAGYWYGPRSTTSCPDFEHYWAARRERQVVASWLLVHLDAATQRTTPIQPSRGAALATLRARVEALPGDQRWWYTIVVGADEGGDHVFPAEVAVRAGRALGPARLMGMLDGAEPKDDPDLVMPPWPESCGRGDVAAPMRRFVLRHASELLRPADADALMRSPHEEVDVWAIAAASLRPGT